VWLVIETTCTRLTKPNYMQIDEHIQSSVVHKVKLGNLNGKQSPQEVSGAYPQQVCEIWRTSE